MFWRLIGTYGVLLVAAIGLLGLVLGRRVEDRERRRIEEDLFARALLVREAIRGAGPEELPQRADALAARDAQGLRISLIDATGIVLADSAKDADLLENHGGRPEVVQATAGRRYGTDVRRSRSTGEELMYVAIPAELPGSPVAVVRVALPLNTVREQIAGVRKIVTTTVVAAGVVALLLTAFFTRRIARPIEEISRAAEGIAAGSYGRTVYTSGRGEVARLARSFNHMSARLAAQFAQLEEDHEQLRAILGGMVEGVVALDAE
ncbi:MAG: HAMP domain-containing protein, partial [Chloroflexota bacterium]